MSSHRTAPILTDIPFYAEGEVVTFNGRRAVIASASPVKIDSLGHPYQTLSVADAEFPSMTSLIGSAHSGLTR